MRRHGDDPHDERRGEIVGRDRFTTGCGKNHVVHDRSHTDGASRKDGWIGWR